MEWFNKSWEEMTIHELCRFYKMATKSGSGSLNDIAKVIADKFYSMSKEYREKISKKLGGMDDDWDSEFNALSILKKEGLVR